MKDRKNSPSVIEWEYSFKNLKSFQTKIDLNKKPFSENCGYTVDFRNIDFKSKLSTAKKNKPAVSSLYFGLLFFFLFGFLFFLAVSIGYASTNKMHEFDESKLYNKASGEKLLGEYLLSDNKASDEISSQRFENNKLSLKEYKALSNDSFSSIAAKFGISVETIYLVNFIKKKTNLTAGKKLIIPNQNGRMIIVQNNDSLFKIADRYAVKWERIVDVNNLQSSVIKPGSKIFIPGSVMTKYEREKFESKNFIMPVSGILTSGYGLRRDPITGVLDFHSGIDIKNKYGTPIRSAKAGKVAFTGWQKIYGNFIIIKHDNELISIYAHLDSFAVKQGEQVEEGKIVGKMGDSGRATGPHLHFEIRKNGKIVNPRDYL